MLSIYRPLELKIQDQSNKIQKNTDEHLQIKYIYFQRKRNFRFQISFNMLKLKLYILYKYSCKFCQQNTLEYYVIATTSQ
ncbi:unnamed protein product [Paramecium octaurelia]|uniref:Uncharacterized protein n=1 Tax=Paramecium octaurelia TaxID=43137 RepID=A0A8S1U9A0_PAROT|nr:unnamed protein product [Paramecium octaurelia]